MSRPNCDHHRLICPFSQWAEVEIMQYEEKLAFAEIGANHYHEEYARLEAENARLRAALTEITELCKRSPANPFLADNMDRIAIAALGAVLAQFLELYESMRRDFEDIYRAR